MREALAEKDRLGFKIIWMQLGVISEEAEKLAEDAGLTVIMDRCPKIEHGRFSGELGWMGINRKRHRQPQAACCSAKAAASIVYRSHAWPIMVSTP